MKLACLLASLVLGVHPPGTQEREHAPHDELAGPRAPVDGWNGFRTVSRLEWTRGRNQEGYPPSLFEAVHVFPDRARWLFVPEGAAQPARRLVYRNGDVAHLLEPDRKTARRLPEPDARGVVLQAAAREALMMYPHGFAWDEPREGRRRAPVPARHGCESPRLGELEVELDRSGRPARLRVTDLDGRALDTLVVEEWQVAHGRLVPRVLVLWQGEDEVWRETVGRVEIDFDRLDLFFTPPDLRASPIDLVDDHVVKSLDLRAVTHRSEELPEGSSWEAARVAATRFREACRAGLAAGLELDEVPTFEVDAHGRPLRVFARLKNQVLEPPAGWTNREERPGRATLLESLEQVPGMLQLLSTRVPAGTRAGTAYVRLFATPAGERVELGFPIEGTGAGG